MAQHTFLGGNVLLLTFEKALVSPVNSCSWDMLAGPVSWSVEYKILYLI